MPIIDAHLHFSEIQSFHQAAEEITRQQYSAAGLLQEYAQAGVVGGVAMGVTEAQPGGFPDSTVSNPMVLDLPEPPPCLGCCLGINPVRLSGTDQQQELAAIEQAADEPWVVGIKIYAGYYPYYVHDMVYEPIYALAASYGLPVVIHCGATWSRSALLQYSHPLHVDAVAVKHPDVSFVVAHLGDPWVMDTAAIVSKNRNVYADLSGLLVKDSTALLQMAEDDHIMRPFRQALAYTDDYSKILFGSDWPLVPVGGYIEFVKRLVPPWAHQQVFHDNALAVFPRLKEVLYGTD